MTRFKTTLNDENDNSQIKHPENTDIDSEQVGGQEKDYLYNGEKAGPIDHHSGKSAPGMIDLIEFDRLYSNTAEVAKNCRKIYFIYLSFLSYALLTVVTTSDLNFVSNESVELPIIKTNIPGDLFFLITPILLIGMFFYIQLYLIKIDELIKFTARCCRKLHGKDCDQVPGCENINKKDAVRCYLCELQNHYLYPWILIFSRYPHKLKGDPLKAFVKISQKFFVQTTIWYFLPVVLATFSLFAIKNHNNYVFFILFTISVVGIGIVSFFWNKNIQSKEIYQRSFFFLFYFLFCCFLIFLVFLDTKANQGLLLNDSDYALLILFTIPVVGIGIVSFFWKSNIQSEEIYQRSLFFLSYFLFCSFLTFWVFLNTKAKQDLLLNDSNNVFFILLTISVVGIGIVSYFWKKYIKSERIFKKSLFFLFYSLFCCFLTFLVILNTKANQGLLDVHGHTAEARPWAGPWDEDTAKARPWDEDTAQARSGDEDVTRLNYFERIMRRAVFVNLRYQKLVREPGDQETYLPIYWASFENMHLEGANLSFSILPKTNLKGTELKNAFIVGAVLQEADLQGANLESAILKNANLKKAFLHGAKLNSADLVEADLSDANLSSADLKRTDFRYANLTDTNLTGTDLSDADLNRSDLRWADLTGAKLDNTNFQNADLRYTVITNCEQLSKVLTLHGAKLDDTLLAELEIKYPHLFDEPVEELIIP